MKKQGFKFWTCTVLSETRKAKRQITVKRIHDLRVALRRCRSMADSLLLIDDYSGWKKVRKLGKRLFKSLACLRDVHILIHWTKKLSSPDDSVRKEMLTSLRKREKEEVKRAHKGLEDFPWKKWEKLSQVLVKRFLKIASKTQDLERLICKQREKVHVYHQRALKKQIPQLFHELRIQLKHLRYLVENFLPSHYRLYGKDLKYLHDCLGEYHDLEVLKATLKEFSLFRQKGLNRWYLRIRKEQEKRLQAYKKRYNCLHV